MTPDRAQPSTDEARDPFEGMGLEEDVPLVIRDDGDLSSSGTTATSRRCSARTMTSCWLTPRLRSKTPWSNSRSWRSKKRSLSICRQHDLSTLANEGVQCVLQFNECGFFAGKKLDIVENQKGDVAILTPEAW